MGITSSTYTQDAHQQPDGSVYVYESHTATGGEVFPITYLAAPGADKAALLASHAAALADMLAEREFSEALNNG